MKSNQTFSITLKHGESFISVSKLVSELATHFHSISEPSQLRIYQIEKSWKIGEQGYVDYLSNNDWKILNNISKNAGLEKFRYGMTDDECTAYNDAIKNSAEKLSWKLSFRAFIPSNKRMAAKVIAENIRESKEIVNFTSDFQISNREIDYNSFISISDAKAWLDSWGISTKEEESNLTPTINHEENKTPPESEGEKKPNINIFKSVTRADELRIDLIEICTKLFNEGKPINPTTVWKILEKPNSNYPCIIGESKGVIKWRNKSGETETLTLKALEKRLDKLIDRNALKKLTPLSPL